MDICHKKLKDFKMSDLIAKKRDKNYHTYEELEYLVKGLTDESIPSYQISAWLMAVYLNGMNIDETVALTDLIAKSGNVFDLSELGNYVVDKHSTGGVGDKTSLILIPLLASVGIPVAKLSGRGLGYTGGTIDKLESIPGFNTLINSESFLNQVKHIGAAIASQTHNLTPADGLLYSLRDVTATVDSIPLIASSVLSKKIASGSSIIILDVKYGSGAFMKTFYQSFFHHCLYPLLS